MRAFDRDLIRGGHYGQRSCEPRKQAEHMAAPTQLQTCRKPLPTGSRPHMALSAFGRSTGDRAMSGGIGAGVGLVGGALVGAPLEGALICGAVGAGTGALTSSHHI